MGSWISQHRDGLLVGVAIVVLLLPFLIGVGRRQLPKDLLLRLALPLAGITAILLLGIRAIHHHLGPNLAAMISLIFGGLCFVGGVQMTFFGKATPSGIPPIVKRRLGVVFLSFGILWLAVSLYRFS